MCKLGGGMQLLEKSTSMKQETVELLEILITSQTVLHSLKNKTTSYMFNQRNASFPISEKNICWVNWIKYHIIYSKSI